MLNGSSSSVYSPNIRVPIPRNYSSSSLANSEVNSSNLSPVASASSKRNTVRFAPEIHHTMNDSSLFNVQAINEDPSSSLFARQAEMNQQVESLKQEVARYKLHLTELVDEINFAETQIAQRDRTIDELKALNSSMEEETQRLIERSTTNLRNDNSDAHNKFEESQRELNELRTLYEEASKNLQMMKQENELIQEENHNLTSELSSLYTEKQRAISELERAKKIVHLSGTSTIDQDQVQMLNNTIENLKNQVENLTETNALLVEEGKYLNQSLDQYKKEEEILIQEKKELTEALQNNGELSHFLNNSAKTATTFEKTILSFKEKLKEADMNKEEEYSALIKSQELRISELVNENQEIKGTLEECRNQLEDAKSEMHRQTTRAEQYSSNINILKTQFEDLKSQWEAKKNTSFSIDKTEKDKLTSQISQLRDSNIQLEKMNSLLKSKVGTLEEQVERNESVEESLEQERKHVEDLNKKLKLSYVKIKRTEDELTRLRNELEVKSKEHMEVKQNLAQTREKVASLQSKLSESRGATSRDVDHLTNRIESMERSFQHKEKEYTNKIELQAKEAEFLAKEKRESELIIEQLKNEIEGLLKDMEHNPSSIERVRAIVGDLQLAKSKIQNQSESIEDMHRDLRGTKTSLSQIQAVLEVMINVLKEGSDKKPQASHVANTNRVISKLNEVSQVLNRNLQFTDVKLQLNTSVDYARSLAAKLEEKESLLDQAIQYVSEVQQEYDLLKEQLELSENDRLALEKELTLMKRTKQKNKSP